MEEVQKCLLCGKDATLKSTNKVGYQEPDTFHIWHCLHCNTAFSMPRVNTDNLYELVYKHAENISGYNNYLNLYKDVKTKKKPLRYLISKNLAFWSIIHVLKKKKIRKTATILEVGAGYGYFTYALHEAGYNAVGLDISKEAIDKALQSFGNYYVREDIFNYAETYPESVDIIILTEVIEHVENPMEFIRALAKLLKKGGYTILTTPNKSFYQADVIWSSANPPMHLWWFSEDSMAYIAQELNLSLEFVNFSESYQARMGKWSNAPIEYPYILDISGNPIDIPVKSQRRGLFPSWFKESGCYQIVSTLLYPVIAKLYPPRKRVSFMCAIFYKQ
jgi:2-polyprenyl-3-methyl-5-hydroxy-6-metoxy-1,4-benzoquinol methylase